MDLPDWNDPDSGVPVGHLEQFLQEVGLIGCLRAVVQVDLLACTVEASGHAEEWRDAPPPGPPPPRLAPRRRRSVHYRPALLTRLHVGVGPRAVTTTVLPLDDNIPGACTYIH